MLKSWGYFGALVGIAAAVALNVAVAAGHFGAKPADRLVTAWWVSMGLMTAVFVLLGILQKRMLWGVLVDENNRISLSRFQLLLWSVLLLPAMVTAASSRFIAGKPDLDFAVPAELWVLLGISVGTAAGALVLNTQKSERDILSRSGTPSWADLFRGDQTDTEDVVDISRAQNVFFTVVTVWAYGTALYVLFANPGGVISSLPAISSGMTTLIAISHAGYLAGKAAPMKSAQQAAINRREVLVTARGK